MLLSSISDKYCSLFGRNAYITYRLTIKCKYKNSSGESDNSESMNEGSTFYGNDFPSICVTSSSFRIFPVTKVMVLDISLSETEYEESLFTIFSFHFQFTINEHRFRWVLYHNWGHSMALVNSHW